jgi:hypothetical protein
LPTIMTPVRQSIKKYTILEPPVLASPRLDVHLSELTVVGLKPRSCNDANS